VSAASSASLCPNAALAEAETPQDLLRFIDRAGAESLAAIDPDLGISGGPISIPGQAETLVEVLEWHAERTMPNVRMCCSMAATKSTASFAAAYHHLSPVARTARRVLPPAWSRAGLLPRQAVALMLPTGQ
jgi:fatty-acyl-CoA synthase